jgi:hypothetical protein
MKGMKTAAFLIGGLWILFELGWMSFMGPSVPVGPANVLFDSLILLGGPTALVLGTLAAIKWGRPAGALLWLGAAVASLGLGFKSGAHVGLYFLAMGVMVLPQVVEGSLFLAAARRREAAEQQARIRRRR